MTGRTARAPKARRSRRPEARPEELIDAALAVFGERGFRAASLEEVARRAGVSKGTVYLYFASKDDLFRALVERKIVVLLEAGEALLSDHDGSAADLLRRVVLRMQEAIECHDMVRIAKLVHAELAQFPEIRSFYWEHVILRNRRLLTSIVDRGIAQGEFREIARTVVPRAVPSLLIHQAQLRALFAGLDRDAPDGAEMANLTLDVLLDGIRVTPKES